MTLETALLEWYARSGRSQLPWRTTRDPYYTLVSEFMLQQTQVDRVIPKFEAFVARFPDVRSLAAASRADVLREWQGLGYNSRAVRLQQVASAVVERHAGLIPREREALLALPGVGPYTAAAIRAFAYNEDDAPMDTNIRRIVHRLFFGLEHPPLAGSSQLDASARAILPKGRGHDWNSALMDLGATVCTARAPKCLLCPLRGACAAAPIDSEILEKHRKAAPKKASPKSGVPFERTTRFARGRIVDALRALPAGQRISLLDLHADLEAVLAGRTLEEVERLVEALERDGLVSASGRFVALAE